jgi:hypothetical protein
MQNIIFKILLFIFIIIICYLIYYYTTNNYTDNSTQNLDNFDIDNMLVIKRTPEYSNLINKLIDDKSFIFNEEQIKILKNQQQIFNIKKNKEQDVIDNISNIIYQSTDKLDNIPINNNPNNQNIQTDFGDEIIDLSNKEYQKITNMLKNDIEQIIEPNSFNTGVLKNDIEQIKNYLDNYYQDVYGNRVDASLKDYFIAYYTLINSNDNVGFPVNTQIGKSNFLIPDQYQFNSHLTNAYNIDWNRIINPLGYSM